MLQEISDQLIEETNENYSIKMAVSEKNCTKTLKILYWNTRSFKKRREEIEKLLKDIDIVVCVESWLSQDIGVQYPGFVTFRKGRVNSKGGGILIFVRKI